MAHLVRLSRFMTSNRPLTVLARRTFADDNKDKKHFTFADPVEHATGEEKIMLILEERGITDPFYLEPQVRGAGTKDNPNVVPAFESKRLVGCVCEEDSNSVKYMWVHKSEPKRCQCGYWFKCVDAFNHFEAVQREIDEAGGLAPLPPKQATK